MAKNRRSFFDKLTGAVAFDEYEQDEFDSPVDLESPQKTPQKAVSDDSEEMIEEYVEEGEGQLTVDVYQTDSEIVIRGIVAGVRPDKLEVSITRDMVTIRGRREEEREVSEENYFFKELYWGAFSRTILLPQEVEVEDAIANEKHGVLTIRLPKIDKEKQTKLKVKSG